MGVFGSLTRRTGLGARTTVGTTGFTRGKVSANQGKGRLTPKMTPRGWYKGVGCRSLGFHTKKGTVVPAKVPVYVIPDLTDCPLKPYVSWSTKRVVVQPLRLPSDKELAQLE
ncbi:uncharacterized protein ACA1_296010 [Acanthamoeba castellanii str. Neff]|uniref:Uncharacterized protein n=1 Tax=Acanthamoeba castellanii (strain ATCC 30010 / Neff) TaxID=1257118 RepID=L8HIT0_ACACF|nr:uncharacterized protein ACA1_296010 [Acanthamoeba castellanii str. Neff]ELR25514.1 hypothetical protein ACA1_296010 [Acanthamoeba castellanii str. Neff]